MMKPTLPFEPEPEVELRIRYPAALDPIYDPNDVIEHRVKRPGAQRKHVFDTEDGYRLIVSREQLKGSPVVLHISVSLNVDPALLGMTSATLRPMSLAKIRLIAQIRDEPRHVEFTGKVLHFIFGVPPLPQLQPKEHVRQQH